MAPTAPLLSVVAALLAATATATTFSSPLRAIDVLARPYASMPDPPTLMLARRQESTASLPAVPAPTSPGVVVNANGSLNITAWDSTTGAACVKHLAALPRSSNPSGTCICYNLPSLDANTGAFEADLRVYRIAEPRDAFAGVNPADIRVGVSYQGASVSPVSKKSLVGMGMVGNMSSISKRAAGVESPELLQMYMFVGQIDKDQIQKNLSMSAFETLLIPTLTLTARSAVGSPITTNVSLNEASFLTGVFSNEIVMGDFSAAQAAVAVQVAALNNGQGSGTVPFVLPGTQVMIFPAGLIIVSVWLLAAVAAYGYGTWQRMQYRDMYKRRLAFQATTVRRV